MQALLRAMPLQTIVIALLFCFPMTSVHADVITLRADTWCPYNCNPNSDRPGYFIEVAKAVFEPAGHKVDYQTMPWKRVIQKVEAGNFTGAVGTNSLETPRLIYHEEELGEVRHVFYIKKNKSWRYTGVESLKKVRLGVILDYVYDNSTVNPYIESHKDNPSLVQIVSGDDALEKNIHKMNLNRIDVVLEAATVFEYVTHQLGIPLSNYTEAGAIYAPKSNNKKLIPIYIGFSPKNPKSKAYAALLDDGIRRLRASGELAKILARYHLKDWKSKEK